ncbi:carboxypeptidase regulatory-like domain-containing protein [Hyalangium sp.]|uniref:carboxypeptidase regulatory-like domain-containing protein n=1 Tax=Hyalangium sp. TaxID=2028555 RepID=UPI002D51C630|nr:carboxypeptidase regulatory-like domain-containing protein [Hyalangium sp.]HYH97109.1 carboxypeptidase regulatory-like domain-containing protein [Hyalangium sp.]
MTERRNYRHAGLLVLALCLVSSPALAQGTSVLLGSVVDASTKQPVADVVVTATSPNLQGEQVVVTESSGAYRIPQLPPGVYTLRFEKEAYKPYAREGIALRLDYSVRLNVELLPEASLSEELVVVGQAPTVDIGSTSTGVNVGEAFVRNIAIVAPTGKGAASRSFESLAELAPGANADTYGVSVSGATSPENQYIVDGISVNDPGFGINGTPLSVEFISEVNVISGGYLPEYGRSTGGVVNAVTKSGSNEFHGSVFGNFTPGALGGSATELRQEAGTISGQASLWNLGDIGAELGGPILQDKLWFYVGLAPSFTRYQLERNLNALVLDADGQPMQDERGFTQTQQLEGTRRLFFADQKSFQYIGKLTYLINPDHNVAVTVTGTPSTSGGSGRFAISERTGAPEVERIAGEYGATATQRSISSLDTSLKWSSSFLEKRLLFNATVGWHHQDLSIRASDGTQGGTMEGLAGISNVTWQRTTPSQHSITEFESLPDPSVCDSPNPEISTLCPVLSYLTGGPGRLDDATLDRYQAKAVGTFLVNAAGQHVFKAGIDLEQMVFDHTRSVTGRSVLIESDEGDYFYDYRQYGYLVGPDEVIIQDAQSPKSKSNAAGAFLQDSWTMLNNTATLNVGLRYDTQQLVGGGKTALVLPYQWSPRLGLIVDPTRSGRMKLFGSYARYYESVPLDMVDRSFPGEPGVRSEKDSSLCDPRDPEQQRGVCQTDEARRRSQDPLDANALWSTVGAGATIVDPDIKPQSTDEFVVGGEYELLANSRVGLSYTRRSLNLAIEDMSRDDGATYFIGNPGYGFAKDFVKPRRNYDGFTLFFQRNFADFWLAQVSYTWSRLTGNYEGLFRSDTGQLDPNINSDFDLVSLLPNRSGLLPADRTHQLKAFGARELVLRPGLSLNLGLSYRGASGTPFSYLGAHVDYGSGQAYILPRGGAGRLPWVHRFDSRLAVNYKVAKDITASLSVDVFNVFNFQTATAYDQNYTYSPVLPIVGGSRADLPGKVLDAETGEPIPDEAINKNFGKPTAYQAPRSFRFGARVSF